MASAHPRTPVLIGAAQYTFRGAPAECPSPQAFMAEAAKRALIDAGIEGGRVDAVDAVGVVGFTLDEVPQMKGLVPTLKNPAAVLAHELGMDAGTTLYTHAGGNTPQALVNLYCERIAKGDCDSVLLGGAEFLGSLTKRLKTGVSLEDWADPLPNAAAPEMFGSDRRGQTPYEDRHGISRPTNVYPLFENAYRHHKGRSIDEHQLAMGELFHPFTKIAAGNPHAWFPTERSAEELGTVTEANRMIGFPYPKFLNSIIQVDQAAALILVSSERADALGIAEEKRLYLHGCADTYELWNPIDRVNFHSSPAIGVAARETLAMAGKTVADIAAFDLYSCFPIAVELACEELGLAPDDPRGLTLTGGLPYFGGPGNNYAMHGIAEAMTFARQNRGAFALSTANGWYLTKHAMGLYSSAPVEGQWSRRNPAEYQTDIDTLAHPEIIEAPTGTATVETYTVIHDRDRVRMAIIVGRDESGRRFVANTPDDEALYRALESSDPIGRSGVVSHDADTGLNTFRLED